MRISERKPLARFLGLILVLSGSLHCGSKQPAVTNAKFASPTPDHSRFTEPCSSCHESTRLAATKDLVTVAHGFGRNCGECHQYDAKAPTWAPLSYSHKPTPTACLGCHSLPGEAAKFKATAHNSGQLRGDCAPCHQDGTAWDVAKNKAK